MSTRRFGRRPNRRQLDPALTNVGPLVLELHGTVVASGDTLVQLTALGALATVEAEVGGPLCAQITLRGIIDGVSGSSTCDEIQNLGATGLGIGIGLLFGGELSESEPFEVQIPSQLGVFGLPNGGRASGTLSSSQVSSSVAGGYLRLTNIADLPSVRPSLMYVSHVQSNGTPTATVTVINAGGGFSVTGDINISSGGMPATSTPVQVASDQFEFEFTGNVNATDTILMDTSDQSGLRGINGSWLAPFRTIAL